MIEDDMWYFMVLPNIFDGFYNFIFDKKIFKENDNTSNLLNEWM